MSSAVDVFVHAIRKRSKKCLTQKVDNLGSFGPIPMVQQPFHSSCVALQYEPRTKFFLRAVPELHCHKKIRNFSTTAWYFCTYLVKILK